VHVFIKKHSDFPLPLEHKLKGVGVFIIKFNNIILQFGSSERHRLTSVVNERWTFCADFHEDPWIKDNNNLRPIHEELVDTEFLN
jgi:hypothetical protein